MPRASAGPARGRVRTHPSVEYSRESSGGALKSLLDKFRAKPEWQSPDAAVRAEAVLRLGADEHETLLALARGDEDARVRRAAVKRIQDPAVLAELAEKDADESVREEAALHLVAAAV